MLIKLGRQFAHAKIRGLGLSDTEYDICAFLYFHDQVSQDTISSSLILDKTTVAKALRVMESKGLIDRRQNESNRRKNIIRLSEAGRISVAHSIDVYDQWLNIVCSSLTDNERQQFIMYIKRIVDHALKIRNQNSVCFGKDDVHE
jgi:DNA-binding MarR family transcriptional regulator